MPIQTIRRRRGVGAALVAIVGLFCTGSPAPAQDAQPPQGQQPFLLALRGQTVFINYTPGALDRAVHVQRRLELVGHDFQRWAATEVRLRVFVLTRDEWAQFGLHLPFGLPGRAPGGTLAVPSYGDSGTVELWTNIRGVPPPPLSGIPMKGTAVEASSLALSDLLMEVEAARVLLSIGGIRGESVWVHQVLAHLLARTAFTLYEHGRLPEITAFFDSLQGPRTEPLSLDRYAAGLDLETLLWFESRFQDGARVLMEATKKNEAKTLIRLARKNGGLLTEAALLELSPDMRAWRDSAFAPSTPVGE